MCDLSDNIKSKKVLVIGMGKSGLESAKFLKNKGAELYIQDNKTMEEFDEDTQKTIEDLNGELYLNEMPDNLTEMDMIVVSPGVPADIPLIKEAKEANVKVIGELELAYLFSKGSFVAITGTNGKTTTTTLVWEIFKAAGIDARLVGNIGSPVIASLKGENEKTWYITEVSSFQLETIKEFSPRISAILNITPDHLDRHKTIEAYGKVKGRIKENQGPEDFTIVNFDDKSTLAVASGTKATLASFSKFYDIKFGGLIIDDYIAVLDSDGNRHLVCKVDDLNIPGNHNLENVLAATTIAYFAGIDTKIIGKVLSEFKGVEHRLEDCGTVKGVQYVNDSKGTNTDAAIKAIEAMKKPIILIAGGYDKKANFTSFVKAFGTRVKHLVLIGATAVKIKNAAENQGFKNTVILPNMQEAVKEAARRAEEGDVVLLSPACASWDQYENFEERGKDFKSAVEVLKTAKVR